jgi:hypothetical protein
MSAPDPRLTTVALDRERRLLENTWREPTGFFGWFAQIDYKSIGR